MFESSLLAFAATVGVLTLVPGADTMLVVRNVIGRGRRAGLSTSLGIGSSLFVQATVSALGLSAILMRSSELYSGVKFAGALYLVGLGVWTIVTARRGTDSVDVPESRAPEAGAVRSYIEGLLTNLLNPKIIVFYLAFLPQFIGPGDPVIATSMLLAGIHFTMTIAWLSTLTFALVRVNVWVSRPAVRRRLDYGTGAMLAVLGARLAFDRG